MLFSSLVSKRGDIKRSQYAQSYVKCICKVSEYLGGKEISLRDAVSGSWIHGSWCKGCQRSFHETRSRDLSSCSI